MSVFLKVHGELIVEIISSAPNTENDGKKSRPSSPRQKRALKYRQVLEEWKVEQGRERRRINELVGYCSGVVGFLRSPR